MDNLAHAQQKLDEFRDFYNQERPHEALDMKPPAEVYQPSITPFPDKILEWEYSTGFVRKVKSTGFLNYEGQGYFLSEAFGDKYLAVVPADTDGVFNVLYRNFRVASIDLKERCIVSRKLCKL